MGESFPYKTIPRQSTFLVGLVSRSAKEFVISGRVVLRNSLIFVIIQRIVFDIHAKVT